MPSPENIRRSQERRAARSASVAKNTQAAIDQEVSLAKLHEQLKKRQSETPKDASGAPVAAVPAPRAKSRKEQRLSKQIDAEKQAEQDLKNTVAPDPEEVNLDAYRSTGRDVPLHVLNQLAKQASEGIRDDAREVASLVGKTAFNELVGRRPDRSRYSRNRRMAEAATKMAQARAAASKGDGSE
jgi:hypothetical protein